MNITESNARIDVYGRVIPHGLQAPAHMSSRRYFQIERCDRTPESSLERLQRHLGISTSWTAAAFAARAEQIRNRISDDEVLAPLLNGVHVPFILPRIPKEDVGTLLEEQFLPAVGRAFESTQPGGQFVNHVPHSLAKCLSAAPGSRHQLLIEAAHQREVVGIYFPCLTEYSVPAALEAVAAFPGDFLLAGGFDTAAALVAAPDLLIRTGGYPPLLWLSGLAGETPAVGYHFEPYGLNLTFNRRAHLGLAAEYWWSGLTVMESE
jgi:hypothetical protein